MFVILWEFEVKLGSEERFEKAYGPAGAWVRLFQRHPHFRGTQLHRDPTHPRHYFTIDLWDSETAYQQFREANQACYAELDRTYEELSNRQRHVLSFTLSPGPLET